MFSVPCKTTIYHDSLCTDSISFLRKNQNLTDEQDRLIDLLYNIKFSLMTFELGCRGPTSTALGC